MKIQFQKIVKKHYELIKYLFWGVLTTIVSWGSYSLFALALQNSANNHEFFHMPVNVFFSNILSWVCAVLFSFVTNKIWVFNSTCWRPSVFLKEFWKFVSSRLATGLLEMVAVPFLVSLGVNYTIFGIEGMLAKVIVSLIIVILNYFFSKYIVFREKN